MRNSDRYIIAGDKEKNRFFKAIDVCLENFRNTVKGYPSSKKHFTALCVWLNALKVKLRERFSEWYKNHVEGIKIPRDIVIPTPSQGRIYRKFTKLFLDKGCEVCGDTRVLHIAHIIPREAGGKDEEWNLMRLCANHHYLFDAGKLTREEWKKIDWKKKNKIVRDYALNVRKRAHMRFWRSGNKITGVPVRFPDGLKFVNKYVFRKLHSMWKQKWQEYGDEKKWLQKQLEKMPNKDWEIR